MSVLTEVLKLFKYDPATDGDMTFNIGQCMNDNWDKLDAALLLAIAAAGAYNPEESYAVGDYCTYKGKLRKCSTAIPTGETWTEAHWTTTTVAAEMQELSSQLSNKAASSLGQVPENDLLTWADKQTLSGAFGINPSITTDGVPAIGWYIGKLDVNAGAKKITLTESNGAHRTWTNTTDAGEWTEWVLQANATPPQEFDLPLAEGWSGWAKYSKDQFGRVLVYGLVAKSTALISGDVIGTFPEGFRPSATCPMTITSGNASDGKSFATSGYVQPSGALTLSNGTISSVYKLGNNLAFNFVFPAAS